MVCNVVVVEYESIGAEGTGGRICVEGSLNNKWVSLPHGSHIGWSIAMGEG